MKIMKNSLLFILLVFPALGFSQRLTRKVFSYENLKREDFAGCDEVTKYQLESCLSAIQANRSGEAVEKSGRIFDLKNDCYHIYDVFGYAMFRHGEWLEGVEVIEKGIEKFGSVPELIKRRSSMSLEMAELGVRQRYIDGNSVFKPDTLPYKEEQFRTENLRSAMTDLEYMWKTYHWTGDGYYVAKIHQMLGEYDVSTQVFQTLFSDGDYRYTARFNIAENYIRQKRYDEAEAELTDLLTYLPKEARVYGKLADVYELKTDQDKARTFHQKAFYYGNIPGASDLGFSEANLGVLKFFADEEGDGKKKLKRLNDIEKQGNVAYTTDVCLLILKLHTNHGNDVEERAAAILAKVGKPAIGKVNALFQEDVATCTITALGDVMATVKDPKSWELMKAYLPKIADMPATLIPPDLPGKMIKFNEDEGVKEILVVVRKLLNEEQSDDPFVQLAGFRYHVYYTPLAKVNKAKVRRIAADLGYSPRELGLLEERMK